jgi:hypothetical protein
VLVVHLRTLPVLAIPLLIVSLLPAGAAAQSSSDPAAGSPPSAVYQIPFEKGRTDAAPRRKDSGDSNADASGSKGGSLYRSENDFGSSSEVPGSASDAPGSAGGDPKDSKKPAGQSGTEVLGTGGTSLPSAAVDSGGTSLPWSLGLLALIVVAGAGIGYLALRARRLGR